MLSMLFALTKVYCVPCIYKEPVGLPEEVPVNCTLPLNPIGIKGKFKVPGVERFPLLYFNTSVPPPLIVMRESTLMEPYAYKARVLAELHERGASIFISPLPEL